MVPACSGCAMPTSCLELSPVSSWPLSQKPLPHCLWSWAWATAEQRQGVCLPQAVAPASEVLTDAGWLRACVRAQDWRGLVSECLWVSALFSSGQSVWEWAFRDAEIQVLVQDKKGLNGIGPIHWHSCTPA